MVSYRTVSKSKFELRKCGCGQLIPEKAKVSRGLRQALAWPCPWQLAQQGLQHLLLGLEGRAELGKGLQGQHLGGTEWGRLDVLDL